MKTFIIYFITALFALSVQAVFFKGAKPDFVLVLVFFYSLRYGQIKGMVYGALLGLLIDASGGFILGPNIISKALAGYFAASVRQRIFQWNIFINTVVITIFSIIDVLLVYICLETFANISFVNISLKTLIMQVIYTVLTGLLLYPVLNPEKDNGLFRKTASP